MCGRILVRTAAKEIARIFRTTGAPPECPSRYNIAPSLDVLAVRYNPADGQRYLNLLHWGLIPIWVKDRAIGYKTINARAEGIAEKPLFSDAFAKRRCIVPSDGFYEWQRNAGRGKQPFAIMPTDGFPFAFAGLWERWRDPTKDIVRSCTIITCAPNAVLEPLHNRMPVILPEENWAKWLGDEAASSEELMAMLKPCPAELMQAYAVSRLVNSPENDTPALIDPLLS